jgi:hypothetical protein
MDLGGFVIIVAIQRFHNLVGVLHSTTCFDQIETLGIAPLTYRRSRVRFMWDWAAKCAAPFHSMNIGYFIGGCLFLNCNQAGLFHLPL